MTVEASPSEVCWDALGGCTYDAIYNLGFATVYDECFQDGALCPEGILSGVYDYVPLKIINLNAATVTKLRSVGGDNEQGYGVVGNQSTFVGNGTIIPSFNFQLPRNYSYQDGCANLLYFEWYADFGRPMAVPSHTVLPSLTVQRPSEG